MVKNTSISANTSSTSAPKQTASGAEKNKPIKPFLDAKNMELLKNMVFSGAATPHGSPVKVKLESVDGAVEPYAKPAFDFAARFEQAFALNEVNSGLGGVDVGGAAVGGFAAAEVAKRDAAMDVDSKSLERK